MTEVAENQTVDARYRVTRRIGSGGMADVYEAQDTHLGRDVALKVLHRRFAQDAEFVERFRREARAAAGLQHPNVVGIFDRGEHEGTYYIAMERLHGETLKDIVAREAPLDPLRSIDLGIHILRAAAFAHRHGIIHRDFKPHNVIVDAGGTPKVTDFGIARAGASEMTETGSIMGTAQYLSPEQAQGHPVTAASDLYSIGVMLYEMLTGRLPFTGDSAVSIALKHLSDPPPPMSADGLTVEPNLEGVVMGALAKDPAARWQSADDFAEALEACRPYVEAQRAGAVAEGAPVVAAPPVVVEEDREPRRRWPAVLIGVLLLVLLATMAYAFTRPEQVDVPKVEGLSLSQARDRLDKAGFEEVEVQRQRSFAPTDQVLRQDPDPGEAQPLEDPVMLVVSRGPGRVIVPSVSDQPQERAIKDLDRAGLRVTADPMPSETVEEGFAIGTSPKAGVEVDRNSRVRLFVSSGPAEVEVPDVVGSTQSSAESRISDAGLEPSVTTEESDDATEGEVLSQDPAGGTSLVRGSTVTITVAVAPEQESVPNVVGLSRGAAIAALRRAGFSATVREESVDAVADNGTVLEQSPGAGTEADDGSAVVIVVGRFEPPDEEPVPPDEQENGGQTAPAPAPPEQTP